VNATTSSVLPLTAIALCLTPRQWVTMLGQVCATQVLETVRQQKNRDIVQGRTQYREPTWFDPTPVAYDSMGAPLYPHQLPA
jgi:hypothetical protein